MAVFLSVDASLKFWRSDLPYFRNEVIASPVHGKLLKHGVGLVRDIEGLFLSEFQDEDHCIELLVPSANRRSRSKRVSGRVLSYDLPENSFYKVKRSVYACCPELLLILYASHNSLIETIALGCELCGSYSLRPDTDDFGHMPVTDVDSIDRFLKLTKGIDGADKCRDALRYIVNGSASPRETDLYMMLCLPPRLGGFGLYDAELNRFLDVKKHLRSLTPLKHISPDICWDKKKVVVEYESDEFHIDTPDTRRLQRNRITKDSIKRRTYRAKRYAVITVTNGEFIQFDEMYRIARLIATLLGKHGLREDGRNYYNRRARLHQWLSIPADKRGPYNPLA